MCWFTLYLLAFLSGEASSEGTTGSGTTGTPSTTPPPIIREQDFSRTDQVLPYKIPESFTTEDLHYRGYMKRRPVYVTVYGALAGDAHFYLSPAAHCQAVWLCFGDKFEIDTDGFRGVYMDKICEEGLRFHPLEQVVYHLSNSGTSKKSYPYYSSLVEIIHSSDSEGNETFKFRPYEDFDAEDFDSLKRPTTIDLNLSGRNIFLMTSSPYCTTTLQRPFEGMLRASQLLFYPNATLNEWPYLPAAGKDSFQQHRYEDEHVTVFDPVEVRNHLGISNKIDCCPPTWEFEGFVSGSEWNTFSKITYQKYTLHLTHHAYCQGSDEPKADDVSSKLYSFLIEIGKTCEWMRLCFDGEGDTFCSDERNTLSLIFIHGVYIPTDSYEARNFALDYDNLKLIRINFIRSAPNQGAGIEMAYAFSSSTMPGVSEMMRLKIYDGKDPTKIVINVVKASNCQARLTNDLASTNLRDSDETELQCLSLSSCTCYENKQK